MKSTWETSVQQAEVALADGVLLAAAPDVAKIPIKPITKNFLLFTSGLNPKFARGVNNAYVRDKETSLGSQSSRKSVISRRARGRRSLASVLTSIWRTRSLVRPKTEPTSSKLWV